MTTVLENKMRGKDWIDFESEIRDIIKFFDSIFGDLYEPLPKQLKELNGNKKLALFWYKLDFSRYNEQKNRGTNCINTCFDFIEKTYQDLEKLIRCLEIYLDDCLRGVPITCYSPDIHELNIDSVLSFNYTAIPTNIYPSLTNVHYIHGCAKSGRPKEENNMVLGVNEYW